MEKRSRPRTTETVRSRPPSSQSLRPCSRQPPRPPSTISFALSYQERNDECPSSRIRIKSGHARTRRTSSRSDICPSPRHGRDFVQSQSGRRSVQSRSGSRASTRCLAPSGGRNTVSKAGTSKLTVAKEKSIEERKSVAGRSSRLSVRTVGLHGRNFSKRERLIRVALS